VPAAQSETAESALRLLRFKSVPDRLELFFTGPLQQLLRGFIGVFQFFRHTFLRGSLFSSFRQNETA
jgi:hypothetical protein